MMRLNICSIALQGLKPVIQRRSKNVVRLIPQHFCQNRGLSSQIQLDISGIYPPIATPFDKDEHIDYGKLESNLKTWNKIDFKGYVVQGSNGEYAYLTQEERVEMVRKVRELIPKDKMIMAGSGCESTRDTITMTAQMASAGADAALVVTPCYYKGGMTNAALEKHFNRVADSSPVPVVLYSVPTNTGLDLAPEVILKLADHPNIIGLKDSGGDISKLGGIVYKTKGKNFQVLAGSASYLYPALAVGCVGGVCGLANILGAECCELESLYKEGRHADAQALQHRLIAPNIGVTRRFGIPGLKEAMDWFGYYGGRTRDPLQPLTDSEKKQLREMFTGSGFDIK